MRVSHVGLHSFAEGCFFTYKGFVFSSKSMLTRGIGQGDGGIARVLQVGGGSGEQLSADGGCVNLSGGGRGEGEVLGGKICLLRDGRGVVGELSHGF